MDTSEGPEPRAGEAPGTLLPCPICRRSLYLESRHGIEVDVCPEHGMWLDAGELEAVVRRLQARRRADQHQAVAAARRQGKMSGILLGWWSLLAD